MQFYIDAYIDLFVKVRLCDSTWLGEKQNEVLSNVFFVCLVGWLYWCFGCGVFFVHFLPNPIANLINTGPIKKYNHK